MDAKRGNKWAAKSPCPRFREALSARLDGESPGIPDDVVDAHVERCEDCARFARAIAAQHRLSRVRVATQVPDLTGEILARLCGPPGSRRDPSQPSLRPRRPVLAVLAAAAAVALAFAGGDALASHLDRPAAAGGGSGVSVRQLSGPVDSSRYPGATILPAGVPKPAVRLIDTAGRPYDLAAETARRVTLVYFGYTHCPDLCPINMALTAAALRDLPAADRQKVTVVFITTDPARDTPKVIRAWLDRFNPGFVGLTGSLAAIHAAEVQVQMPLSYAVTSPGTSEDRDYLVVHAGYTLVYGQDGRANLSVDDSVRPDQYAVILEHLLSYGFREPN